MRKLFFICAALIVALTFESCSTNFEKLVETGKYKEAEGVLGRMKGENQNECADILIKNIWILKNMIRHMMCISIYARVRLSHYYLKLLWK